MDESVWGIITIASGFAGVVLGAYLTVKFQYYYEKRRLIQALKDELFSNKHLLDYGVAYRASLQFTHGGREIELFSSKYVEPSTSALATAITGGLLTSLGEETAKKILKLYNGLTEYITYLRFLGNLDEQYYERYKSSDDFREKYEELKEEIDEKRKALIKEIEELIACL